MSNDVETPVPGWYDDPMDAGMSRFWNGTAWTANTRRRSPVAPTSAELDPVEPARRVANRRAATSGAVAAALGLVIVGVVTVLVLRPDEPQVAAFNAAAEQEAPADDSGADGSPGQLVEPVADPPVPADAGERWPWQEGAEGAPVAVDGGPKWVVVASSLNAQDFTIQDAEHRAAQWAQGTGQTPLVLLSDHYPSLNPGLWVVAFGPYEDESSAAHACATGIEGGCYARVLSVDAGDRYCIASDGCKGERE